MGPVGFCKETTGTIDYVTTSYMVDCNWTSNWYGNAFYDYNNWVLLAAEIRKNFRAFLERLAPRKLEPNPLSILMRAVNSVRLRAPIRQPCWRSGRWRSLT